MAIHRLVKLKNGTGAFVRVKLETVTEPELTLHELIIKELLEKLDEIKKK